jgi:hypothetical protein
MQLTVHFSDLELGVVNCEQRLLTNATNLCTLILEPIRAKFGEVRVHDGYRPPERNAAVGGKATSYHLFDDGRAAADVDAPAVTIEALFDWLRLESGLLFDKVILETNDAGIAACVHIQVDMMSAARRLAYTGHTGAGVVYVPAEVK